MSNHPTYDLYANRHLSFDVYIKDMLENVNRYKWILSRLDNENPSSAICHDWNVVRNRIGEAMPKLMKAYKKLCDVNEKGETPTSIQITTFEKNLQECGKLCNSASSCLVISEFYNTQYKQSKSRHTVMGNRVVRDKNTFKVIRYLDDEC